MDTDRALAELKKLREGKGLRVDRLTASPHVLSSCATSDPVEARQMIEELMARMSASEQWRALAVDFGLNLDELLQRPPTGRELDYLGERRSGYAEIVGRDVKTLARWSNSAVEELRAHLLVDQFDGNIVIAAGVKNRSVVGVDIQRFELSDDHFQFGTTISSTNPHDSSLPLVLYGFPRDWRPTSIRFAVAFLGDEQPDRVWALVAESMLDVGFGNERTDLPLHDGVASFRVENPRRDQLYGVWWEW